jgi:hypothetical protein
MIQMSVGKNTLYNLNAKQFTLRFKFIPLCSIAHPWVKNGRVTVAVIK